MRTVKTVEFAVGYVGQEPCAHFLDRARWLDVTEMNDLWMADERFYRDPWVLLSLIGQATRRLRVGTCVTDPFVRHPALTANAIATLDELTSGRAVLGMGAGISGFAALGIERRSPATALREAIHVIRALTRGEHIDFSGKMVNFRSSQLNWRPPRVIPVNVAGRGPKMLELGGEFGDGVVIASFASGPGFEYALRHVDIGLARRPSTLGECKRISWLYTCVSTNRAAAREAVKRGIAVALWGSLPVLEQFGVELPSNLLSYMRSRPYSYSYDVIKPAMDMIPENIVEDL